MVVAISHLSRLYVLPPKGDYNIRISYLYKVIEICAEVNFAPLFVVTLFDLEVHLLVSAHYMVVVKYSGFVIVTEWDRG